MSSEGVKSSLFDDVDISIVVAILPSAAAVAAAGVDVGGVGGEQQLLVGRRGILLLTMSSTCSPPWIDPGHPLASPEWAGGGLRLGVR